MALIFTCSNLAYKAPMLKIMQITPSSTRHLKNYRSISPPIFMMLNFSLNNNETGLKLVLRLQVLNILNRAAALKNMKLYT